MCVENKSSRENVLTQERMGLGYDFDSGNESTFEEGESISAEGKE